MCSSITLHYSVADPHRFDADPDASCNFDVDPDPAFHFDADPDPVPACHFDADTDSDPSFQIQAQNTEKLLKEAHIPYIFSCHLQIDADPDPYPNFDPDP